MRRRASSGRTQRRPTVERLEDRRLLAVTIADIPLASSGTQINGVAAYPDGNIWFTATSPAELGVLHPATDFVLEIPLNITNSAPDAIAVAPNGLIYFTDPGVSGQSAIGVFNPATLKYFEVATPTVGADPNSITVANDGTVWFTENAVGKIGEYNPATQTITEYPLANSTNQPNYIQVAPDGTIWFGQYEEFDSINPTTHAITRVFAQGDNAPASGFSFTSDGDLWYMTLVSTEPPSFPGSQYAAVRYDPGTGVFTDYPPSGPFSDLGHPLLPSFYQAATGADGNVYFNGFEEIDVATGTILAGSSGATTNGIVSAPDGELYGGGTGQLIQGTIIPANQSAIYGEAFAGTPYFNFGTPLTGRTVFVDLKGDGAFDPGDPSGVTDAKGKFAITGVPVGTYNVRVAAYPGDFTTATPVTTVGGTFEIGVSAFLQPSSAVLQLTLSANPFGANNPDVSTAEVAGLYNIILGRAPDPSGLAFYTDYLKGGGTIQAVASALLNSTEYETGLVASYYYIYLGRAGSSAEIAGWVNAMQGGLSAEEVTTGFMTSSEFNARFPDNASFIQALYGDVLGRTATSDEVAAWSADLATSTRAALIGNVLHSAEAGERVADGFYAEFCLLPPDPTGVANVVAGLAGGITMAEVAATFAASPTFIARANASVG